MLLGPGPPPDSGASGNVDGLVFGPTSWLCICPFSTFFLFPPVEACSTLAPVRPSTRQLRACSSARSCRFSSCSLLTAAANGLPETDSSSTFCSICFLNALTSTWTSLTAACRLFLSESNESGSSTVLSMIQPRSQRRLRRSCYAGHSGGWKSGCPTQKGQIPWTTSTASCQQPLKSHHTPSVHVRLLAQLGFLSLGKVNIILEKGADPNEDRGEAQKRVWTRQKMTAALGSACAI